MAPWKMQSLTKFKQNLGVSNFVDQVLKMSFSDLPSYILQ